MTHRLAIVSVFAFLATLGSGCTGTVANRNPVGEMFPSVQGESLAEDQIRLPDSFFGEPVLLLVGFVQESQFDIDRWLIALEQVPTKVRVIEVPAIRGAMWRAISGYIDDGMRSGIPKEMWPNVVTVYTGSDEIAEFVGTQNVRNARVLLLDGEGKVTWFHDQGFSPNKFQNLVTLIQ